MRIDSDRQSQGSGRCSGLKTLLFGSSDTEHLIAIAEAWIKASRQLLSGLASIIIDFKASDWIVSLLGNNEARNGLGLPELLGNRIMRCCAPEAKVSLYYGWAPCLNREEGTKGVRLKPRALSPEFNQVEDWSKGWLEWWATSHEERMNRLKGSLPCSATTAIRAKTRHEKSKRKHAGKG